MKIIFLGAQGSGKSTQAKLLSEHLNLPYIEMGQLFRDRAELEDELGKKIKQSLDAGVLVDNEIAVKSLHDELAKEKYQNGYILDGYPRNQQQMEGLQEDIDKVFYVKVTDNEAIKRLMLRKRADDTEDLLAKRLEVYHEKTEPLLKQFKEKGILIEIDGEQSIKDVDSAVLKFFN